jgi:hypothetical protein
MKNPVTGSDIELQKITADVPKGWIVVIDKFCKISFIARRKWLLDAIREKLERDKLLEINTEYMK